MQAFLEIVSVSTSQRTEKPLSAEQACQVVEFYLAQDIRVLTQQSSQLYIWLNLIKAQPSRKRLFDTMMAFTLHDNNIPILYTVNTKDFQHFAFLTAINPLNFNS